MVGIVMIAAIISTAIGVTSYRYSVKKANAAIEKIERPDLITVEGESL